MSDFWSGYIIVLVLGNIVAYGLLLHFTGKVKGSGDANETTGHVYDGIEELNTPMPRWWIVMFWVSIVFALVYLFLYPGLGSYKGYLGWTSQGQWQKEVELADKKFGPIYQAYGAQSIEELIQDPKALKIGQRLFGNNCAACHGSDANGSRGFPNLADHDWLYGGKPENIEASILHGRSGMMPPMGMALGGDVGVAQVAAYVRSLSGQKVDFALAEEGKKKFQVMCIACHGVEAKGNPLLGAPNLSDNIWLYGGDAKTVQESIANGRSGKMPAQKDTLGADKVRLLAAYVYSLSVEK